MANCVDCNLKLYDGVGEFDGGGELSLVAELEKLYRFQSLHPTYSLSLAMVGDDQLLEGVVKFAIFVPLFVVSRMKM